MNFNQIDEKLKAYDEQKKKYSLDQTLYVTNLNFSNDLKTIKENHLKDKKVREENLEIEKTTEQPVKKKKTYTPRTPRKKKAPKEKGPTSLLEKTQSALDKIEKIEEEKEAEEEEEVKEVKKKRKKKKEIEVIPSDLINQSIDEFLFPKSDRTEEPTVTTEVIEESSIVDSLKKNPRKRKISQKFE